MEDRLYTEFIHDAEELIEKLFHDIEDLRANRLRGRPRREIVARLFRHVHTLKGSTASHGAKTVSVIAHEFENVLDGVRLGRLNIEEPTIDAFEAATQAMAAQLSAAAQGKTSVDPAGLIDQLHTLTSAGTTQNEVADLRASLPEEITRSLSEYDQQHLREAVEEGARLFVVSAGFEIETFDQRFRELSQLLNQTGEVICTVPAPEPAPGGEINLRLLYAAESMTEDVIERAPSLGRIEFSEIVLAGRAPQPASASSQSVRSYAKNESAPPAMVRVGLSQLDEIISDAGELFRDAAVALESLATQTNKQIIESASSQLRQRFVELEERLIKLRLVPLGQMLERAAVRAGRIAARELGKDVEFEITGGDVGIDRSLADAIADPLLHLVRNAVSHGIETPEERVAAGKTARGRVRIGAFSEGSQIHICVADDGRGIAPERVATAAAEDGIVGAGSDVTMAECLRLIFRPGFSTAESLSNVSGRGIGLDVVDRAMSQAGGGVRVATEPGAGTTFEMIVPATLALLRCLIVRSGDQAYCFESERIADRVSLSDAKNGHKEITWQSEKLPLISLRSLLGQSDRASQSNGDVIILQTADRRLARNEQRDRVALLVDSVEEEHETLVRSLGRHASRWTGVSGATELLDGSVALVLDLEQLLEKGTHPERGERG
jgi:two-component system, chemotaxis family, sensor kinase CheA